jgi:hypothetical protein
VAIPLITSTSAITGTGLKKCMPITRCASAPTALARSVIEMLEVLVASTACAGKVACISRKIFFLTSTFSVAASTAQSADFASAMLAT